MTTIEWVGIALACIVLTVAGFVIGYMIRRSEQEPLLGRGRPCKHGGGFCKDIGMFNVCPDDPTQKVECWMSGVFEDDPFQHDIQVDLGGGPEEEQE